MADEMKPAQLWASGRRKAEARLRTLEKELVRLHGEGRKRKGP